MHGLAFFWALFTSFVIILHNFTQVSVYCRHLISQPRGCFLQDSQEGFRNIIVIFLLLGLVQVGLCANIYTTSG